MRRSLGAALVAWAARLRFPYLLLFTATLFVLDLIVPDFIPLADEILLGLGTALLASWKKRGTDAEVEDARAGDAEESRT